MYEQIKERIKAATQLTPDETGWRIGGRSVWLHGWVGDDGTTCYVIAPQRSAEVLAKVIGSDWSGSMTHDGCASYDRFEQASHQQCVDHALRRARSLVDKQRGSAKIFPQQVIDLFREALQMRDRFAVEDASPQRRSLAYALTEAPRRNAENERFAKHLYNHRAEWFVFLIEPNTPATNHRAEQALKTPIVNRKVWGGNRTGPGGNAQAVICSVLETCKNKAIDVFDYLSNGFRGMLGHLFA